LSANTFQGLAWNMASMPWNSDYFVLEMAIAGMARASKLARPQVAVVTNIGPAHLQYHDDTITIAKRKAALFDGMPTGSQAIVNLDMDHADVFLEAARRCNLQVIGFSQQQPKANIVARSLNLSTGKTIIQVDGAKYVLQLGGLT